MEYNIKDFLNKLLFKLKKENNLKNVENYPTFSNDRYIELTEKKMKINLTPKDTIYIYFKKETETPNKIKLMYNNNQGFIEAPIKENGKINERYITREELFYIIDKLIKFEANLCIIKNNDNIKSIRNYRKKIKRQ